MEPRIWLIAGPTASGKSALALRLARTLGAEIVNADAIQLYADLRILSARPSPDEEAQAPHHLFGVADAADGWSVGRWSRAAMQVLGEIAGRKRHAVLVGGTGLYFKALTDGLAEIPPTPPGLRLHVAQAYENLGEAVFREHLARMDPISAQRIAPGDQQRLKRAWEVRAGTGRSLPEWQADTRPLLAPGAWSGVALNPPRDLLFQRCDDRLDAMAASGAVAEAAALDQRDLPPDLPALKAVGFREFAAQARGEMPQASALAAAKMETRRYAKRQSTWLRGQMADWPRIDSLEPEDQWRQFLALNPALTP